MMQKTSWNSMYLRMFLFFLICCKTSSDHSSTSEFEAEYIFGVADDTSDRLPNENDVVSDSTDEYVTEDSVTVESGIYVENFTSSLLSDSPWVAAYEPHNATNASRIILTTLRPEMHANGTEIAFICTNITLNLGEYKLTARNAYTKEIILKMRNLTHSGETITVCKPVAEDKIHAKYSQRPQDASYIIASFIYSTFSLLCAWACIISVPKFVVLFLASNVFTFFLICVIFTGSFTDFLVYLIPIHINFFFFLITGWVTILSCKVVFEHIKSHGILSVSNNGEIMGNSFYMFHVTVAISCFFPIITGISCKFDMFSNFPEGNPLESLYFRMMAQFTLSVILVLITVILVDVVFTSRRKKMQDSGVRHTRFYLMFFCYHLFSMVSWVYGFVAVTLRDYPQFWKLYMFVAMALPIFFLKDVILTAKVRISFRLARSGNPVEVYRIRVHPVY